MASLPAAAAAAAAAGASPERPSSSRQRPSRLRNISRQRLKRSSDEVAAKSRIKLALAGKGSNKAAEGLQLRENTSYEPPTSPPKVSGAPRPSPLHRPPA